MKGYVMPKVKVEGREVSYEVYFIDIRWGGDPDETEAPAHYTFDTEVELNAFVRGIDEAVGWTDFDVVNEGKCYERYGDTAPKIPKDYDFDN